MATERDTPRSIILDQTHDNDCKSAPIIRYNKSEVPTYSLSYCKICPIPFGSMRPNYTNNNDIYFKRVRADILIEVKLTSDVFYDRDSEKRPVGTEIRTNGD